MISILCENCGHVMSVILGRCILCKSKNLTQYGSPKSTELQRKVEAITGRKRPAHPRTSAIIAVTVTTLAMYGAQFGITKFKEYHKAHMRLTKTYVAGRQVSVFR